MSGRVSILALDTFSMASFVVDRQSEVVFEPSTTLILIAIALTAAIFANTYYHLLHNRFYKWQYGLFRFIAFAGMAVLSYATAGFGAVIPTMTTFLGMELQRLMQLLDLHFHTQKQDKVAKR